MNAHPDLNKLASPVAAHLTDDQIDDHLIGDLAPEPAAHLAACSLCAERVADAASPIDSFQAVSTAWSERRSATLPIPIPTPARPLWQRHYTWATGCLTLAFGIALINASHQAELQPAAAPAFSASSAAVQTYAAPTPQAAIQPVAMHARTPRPTLTETASIAPARAAQISADNHMLRSIEAAFNPSSDTPASLGLAPEDAQGTRAPASLQNPPVLD